jgi:hypothetical protein
MLAILPDGTVLLKRAAAVLCDPRTKTAVHSRDATAIGAMIAPVHRAASPRPPAFA